MKAEKNLSTKNKSTYQVVLIGQPNCGKSTFFNAVAGYKATASNFPGTTVSYTSTHIKLKEIEFDLIDLPGTYSLSGYEPAEKVTRDWLLNQPVDLVINIIDASILGRSLELTIELLELGLPVIVCLNMMDEAKRKGIEINHQKLSQILNLPVIPCIATKGEGIEQLFEEAKKYLKEKRASSPIKFSQDVETVYEKLRNELKDSISSLGYPDRFFILKLLEGDAEFTEKLMKIAPEKLALVNSSRAQLEASHGKSSDEVICSERHALALNIFEKVAKVTPRKRVSLREQVDYWLMHKYLGYVFLAIILFLLFAFVFWVGKYLEEPLLGIFDRLQSSLENELGRGLLAQLIIGLIQGIAGGVGIVLPYLVPFLLGLSFLEDIGYLPRAAFLMDSFMHRIGLHGKAVIPFVLGYGCSVPAVMATRTLEHPRDRFIAGILVTMIPCSARTTIIFGLVAYFLGPIWALLIYLLNLFVIAGVGRILTFIQPEPAFGLIMEVPTYKLPSPKVLVQKTWFRLREFIVVAWPILIAGSILLSILEFYQLDSLINKALSPLVAGVLGLPKETGVTLIFGIMRKELSLIMLAQALGTTNFAQVLTQIQMVVFTIFVVFYIPCLATLASLWRELGWKGMLSAIGITLFVATFFGFLFRIILTVFGF